MITLTDAQYMTAAEKQQVLKALTRFVKNGLPAQQFTKAAYKYLYLHMSFIAHYDIHGFYSSRFADPHGRVETIEQITRHRCHDDAMRDIHDAVQALFAEYADTMREQATQDRLNYLQDVIAMAQAEIADITGPQPLRLVK